MAEAALDFVQAEQLLLESEFRDCRQVWSSNYVYLAQLCGPGGQPFAAIYKPRRGETPLWDFPPGTLYKREVAAYRLAGLLEWPFVPPTVVRDDGPEGAGSLQLFVRHDPQEHFFVQRERPELLPQLHRICAFDFVANNADRKGGHCLLDGAGNIWGIDHGLCFHSQLKLRSVIWDWAGELMPPEVTEGLRRGLARIETGDESAQALHEMLSGDERRAMRSRLEQLVEGARFPMPGVERHYPWPLV